VESARLRLLAGWGSAIAERHELTSFVQSLSSLSNVLVQLEVPAGQPVAGVPSGARLLTLAREDQPIEALYLGPAPAVNPQTQGRGFLFLVNSNSMRLAPGAAVSGFLTLPGEAVNGVLVPRDAVLRYKGATWVYLELAEDKYQRTEVFLKAPQPQGWFVERGLKPGDQVLTVGAQQLLSEELKGQETE
jgi:multidrug efflux pump subunit AcrA (membrane-fusion protein)